ncbi:nucleoporin NUP35 [Aplysia californica]|uniref:Nucleoporin NUP53 n=1 Tax=Aplysia californica TaxID=6500 RepID=A0ABM0K762_APLCA|nr:nucleoporin NUP35 [Aplysia californica]
MFSIGSDSMQHGHDSMMSLSPSSPGQHAPSHSSPFLPGYLLGDHPSHHHAVSSPRLWSSGSSQSPGPKSSAVHFTPSGPGLVRRDSTRKVGGPPVKSLYSSSAADTSVQGGFAVHGHSQSSPALRNLSVSSPAPPTTGLFQMPGGSRGDTSVSGLGVPQTMPLSPAQADPFYTQGDLKSDDQLDETWVTVFGFPPGATSFILQQFSQYGTVLKHVVASECNWMHLHYLSKIQAKKALSKDGKVFGGCMKIGVTPCIEKSVMEEKENSYMSRSLAVEDSIHSPGELNSSKLTPIRPLTAAYVASRGEYEVLRDKQTPKRDAGLVSKFKEYMFGY